MSRRRGAAVPRPDRAPARPRRAVVVAAATVAGLALGFLLKDACLRADWSDGDQYRQSCYNDAYPLYFRTDAAGRSLKAGDFPYLSTEFEYPVGTGLYVGVVAAVASDAAAFFRLNAVGLFLSGGATAAALYAMARRRERVLFFALAPALVLYAFHNWDLIAVALATGALYAFWRGADGTAGFLLGLGAAAKLYPGLLLPALALARMRETRRLPWRMAALAVSGFALVNLPVLLAAPGGWLHPWRFQSTRFPNYETSWYFLYHHASRVVDDPAAAFASYGRLTGIASGLAFVLAAGALMAAEARRERIRPYALSLGIVVVFLLTAKVFSPQFVLWVLPFFAVLDLRWYHFAALSVTEAAVWFAISAYLLVRQQLAPGDPDFRLFLVEVAVLARYAALAWILVASRSAAELVAPPPAVPARAAAPGHGTA